MSHDTCAQYTRVSARGRPVGGIPGAKMTYCIIERMQVYLSLGSNLGDRAWNIRNALDALSGDGRIRVQRISSLYETEPVGTLDQPAFLNLAAEIETALEPLELLNVAKTVEAALGRVPSERWGPRIIDIDIVLWGDRIVTTDTLTIPHKEFRQRAFVLMPLCQIAPHVVDPVTGLTIEKLAASAQGHVELFQG